MTKTFAAALIAAAVGLIYTEGAAAAPVERLSDRVTVVAWVDGTAIDPNDLAPHASKKVHRWFAGMAPDAGPVARGACYTVMTHLYAASKAEFPPKFWYYFSKKSVAEDSLYAQAMLLKSTANAKPKDLASVMSSGDYRLINDFQVSYGSALAARTPHRVAKVGRTPLPCGLDEKIFDDIKDQLGHSDAHPEMHDKRLCRNGLDTVMQVSQGRLGKTGRNIQQLLSVDTRSADQMVPWIWATVEFNGSGEVSRMRKQVFPTYYVYINGELDEEESSTPQANFADFLNPEHPEYTRKDFEELSKDLTEGGCR